MAVLSLSGEADVWGRAGWTCRAFPFMQGSNDAAKVRGSFQKTAPRKTAENTVKHRAGGVGSVVANHRGGGERSVVVTTLQLIHCAESGFQLGLDRYWYWV